MDTATSFILHLFTFTFIQSFGAIHSQSATSIHYPQSTSISCSHYTQYYNFIEQNECKKKKKKIVVIHVIFLSVLNRFSVHYDMTEYYYYYYRFSSYLYILFSDFFSLVFLFFVLFHFMLLFFFLLIIFLFFAWPCFYGNHKTNKLNK